MYIALEGVVGVGKSTQSKLLQSYLQKKHPEKTVLLIREPGGTQIAEAIRTLVQATPFDVDMHPLTDAYLYAAARAELLHTVVKPALDSGSIVISDRSVISSLTIQGVAQGMGIQTIRDINKHAVSTVLPDMILFLDLDVNTGLSRTFDAGGDKFESKKAAFSHHIYEGYKQLSSFVPIKDLICRIDANGSKEEIHDRIITKVESFIRITNVLDF